MKPRALTLVAVLIAGCAQPRYVSRFVRNVQHSPGGRLAVERCELWEWIEQRTPETYVGNCRIEMRPPARTAADEHGPQLASSGGARAMPEPARAP